MGYLDGTGLSYLISKIKAAFWSKTDVVQISIDNTPTESSNNLVKSGGVYAALEDKQDEINSSNKLPYSLISGTPTIPDEVEANPTVPSGTTPGTMETIKIGSQYYELGGGTIDAEDYSGTAPLLVDPSNYYTKSETEALVETPVASTQPSGGFLPNVIYDLGEITGSVTFALATPTDNTIANTYVWTFETGSTAPTVV